MTPTWASFLSRNIASIACYSAGSLYIARLYTMKASDFAAFGIATFGFVAALSGLCYTKAGVMPENEKSTFTFCGEKFLHASILLLQTIVLKFAQDGVSDLFASRPLVSGICTGVFYLLTFATGAYAFYFIFFGFQDLNNELWRRYLDRLSQKKNRAR